MASDTKILPVALTQDQREHLRVMAFDKCVAMTELIRWWIDEKWASYSGPKTSTAQRKVAPVTSVKGIERGLGGDPVRSSKAIPEAPKSDIVEGPIMRKCARCFESSVESRMTRDPRTGKYFCADCVENMKNGQ